MGEQEIAVVNKHIYLGCVVDEHGHCRRMVEESKGRSKSFE